MKKFIFYFLFIAVKYAVDLLKLYYFVVHIGALCYFFVIILSGHIFSIAHIGLDKTAKTIEISPAKHEHCNNTQIMAESTGNNYTYIICYMSWTSVEIACSSAASTISPYLRKFFNSEIGTNRQKQNWLLLCVAGWACTGALHCKGVLLAWWIMCTFVCTFACQLQQKLS